MRFVCHFVPVLLCGLAFSVSGCFLMHGADGEPGERCLRPSGMICCAPGGVPLAVRETVCPFRCPAGSSLLTVLACTGRPPPPPPPPDGGRPPAPPDAGPLECPVVRADATCLESFAVAPGRPFALPVLFDACTCCAETECRAVPDFASRTLRLTTTMCPDPCDCDRCNTPSTTCAVPALPAGEWDVVVNGDYAFSLPVIEDSGLIEPFPGCASYAEPDLCDFDDRIELHPSFPSMVCVTSAFEEDRLARVSLSFACPGCGELNGTCDVSLEPRFTDDLPPGGELHIVASLHFTDCDVDCPPECSLRTQECILPPLEPGSFYRIWFEGSPVLSFTTGTGTAACAISGGIVPG